MRHRDRSCIVAVDHSFNGVSANLLIDHRTDHRFHGPSNIQRLAVADQLRLRRAVGDEGLLR